VWEVVLLLRSHKSDAAAVARRLRWPQAKIQAAGNYAEAFPQEIEAALAENEATDFLALQRLLPQAAEFVAVKRARA
jgi:hypothetical protein